ncbi:MAG: hypothetical protein ABSH25_22740 [Syntrophorhabdales bacterium]|jgi:hypothetical protein
MSGLTTGAKKTTKVDGRDDWARSARGAHAAESDHLRRLCASLAEAARLIPLSGGGTIDEEAFLHGRAHSLDALAFAMAVDAVLFLDALGENTPISPETGTLVGRTIAAIDCLLHSLEGSQDRALEARANESRLCDAIRSLGKTARNARTKLANLRGLRIVAEFHSPVTSDVRCANHAGQQGGGGQN